jgi:Heterokaryon incompatibility protein Het-C
LLFLVESSTSYCALPSKTRSYHVSQASVSDLNKELSSARSKSSNGADSSSMLRGLLLKLPSGAGGEITREMEGVERIRAGPSGGGKRPEDMSPQEMHAVLWQVLSFRDSGECSFDRQIIKSDYFSVVKKIEMTIGTHYNTMSAFSVLICYIIEKIPGLGPLIEKLMDSIAVFVYTTLEVGSIYHTIEDVWEAIADFLIQPFLKPLLQTASTGLATSSAEVIDTHDQYEVCFLSLQSTFDADFLFFEVFNNPRAVSQFHDGYTFALRPNL